MKHLLPILFVAAASVSFSCGSLHAADNCDDMDWHTLEPGHFMRAKSVRGQAFFGGFWEFRKSTPDGTPAFIHRVMHVDGYKVKAEINVTCRSRYLELEYGGSAAYDYSLMEFVNELQGEGFRMHPDDACSEARKDPVLTAAVPTGIVRDAGFREHRVLKGEIVPEGKLSPSWGPSNSPENTHMRFRLRDDAIADALARGKDVEEGEEWTSYVDWLQTSNEFADNPGGQVTGTVAGQAVQVDASIALPCGGDLQLEAWYTVEDEEGNRYEEMHPGMMAQMKPGKNGRVAVSFALPLVPGLKYTLDKLRYRKVPECARSSVSLGSARWLENLGSPHGGTTHHGLIQLELTALPASIQSDHFTVVTDAASPTVVVFADTMRKRPRSVRTPDKLLRFVELADGGMELASYSIAAIDWVASAQTIDYQLVADAQPMRRTVFRINESDDGQRRLVIDEHVGNSAEPARTFTFTHDLSDNAWILERSDATLVTWNRRTIEPEGWSEWRGTRSAQGTELTLERLTYTRVEHLGTVLTRHCKWANPLDPESSECVEHSYTYDAGSGVVRQSSRWSDGFWMEREHDINSAEAITISPSLDSQPGQAADQHKVESVRMSTSVDGQARWIHRMDERGHPVAIAETWERSSDMPHQEGIPARLRIRRQLLDQKSIGSAGDGTFAGMEAMEWLHASGRYEGWIGYSRSTAGVERKWQYQRVFDFSLQEMVLKVTMDVGVRNASEELHWIESVEQHFTAGGSLVMEKVTDLASGLLLNSRRLLERDDSAAGSSLWEVDGKLERHSRDCCSAALITSEDGSAEGNWVNSDGSCWYTSINGIRHWTTRKAGAEGMELSEWLEAADGATLELRKHYLDGTGRVTGTKEGKLWELQVSRSRDPSTDGLVVENSYKDGTVETLLYHIDGRLKERRGAADGSAAFAYEHGSLTLGGMDVPVQVLRSHALAEDSDGNWRATGEQRSEYRDMLGRVVRRDWQGTDASAPPRIETIIYLKGGMQRIITDHTGAVTHHSQHPLRRWLMKGTDDDGDGQISANGTDTVELHEFQALEENGFAWWESRQTHISPDLRIQRWRLLEQLDGDRRRYFSADQSWQQSSTITQDASGLLVTTTRFNDGRVRTERYLNGLLVRAEDRNAGGELLDGWSAAYDAFGRLAEEQLSGQGKTVYTYDDFGSVASVRLLGADGEHTVFDQYFEQRLTQHGFELAVGSGPDAQLSRSLRRFDAFGRLAGQIGDRGLSYRLGRDSQGRCDRLWKGAFVAGQPPHTTWAHADASAGASLAIESAHTGSAIPEGDTYDSAGRRIEAACPFGVRTFSYADQRLQAIQWQSGPLAGWRNQLQYADDGTLQQSMWSKGDNRYAVVQRLREDDTGVPAGRLTRIASAAGSWNFHYDAESGMLLAVERDGGPGAFVRQWTYDALGLPQHVQTTLGTHVFSQTAVRRIDGLITQIEDERDLSWEYDYTSDGQLSAAALRFADGSIVPGNDYTFGYDDFGNRVASVFNGWRSDWRFSFAEHLVDRGHDTGSVITGTAVSDAVANVTAEPGVVAFAGGYFAVDVSAEDMQGIQSAQLIDVLISSHAADPAQPPLASARVPALLISGPQQFTYGDDGLLASDGRWLFQWDEAGRLAQVNTHPQLTAAGVVPLEVHYLYDGDGRLVHRETRSGDPDAAVVMNRYYLYEDDLLVMEIEDGVPVREYTYGPDFSGGIGTAGGIGGLLAVRDPQSGAVFLPFTDIHGHVRGYMDASNGRMVARYDYGPFGKLTRATGELAGQFTHGMHTMLTDPLTGLVRYRHRWYDPSTGRWLSPDPLGEDGSPNRYQFCGNDPINRFDADGRLTFFWHGNWGGPGRVNGVTGKWRERDRFPRQGDPDWEEPADEQDWCYYHHDTCLSDLFCGYNGLYTNRQFTDKEKGCDDQLSDCLFALPGFHIKAAITGLAFRTLIGPMRVARYAPKRRSGSFRPSHLQSHFPDQACSCNHPHPVRQPGDDGAQP